MSEVESVPVVEQIKNTDVIENGSDVQKVEINTPKAMTEQQRLEQRLKKFGAQTENLKKEERGKRFGVSASGGGESSLDQGKIEQRAKRFGTAPSTPTGVSNDLLEKRAKRFGVSNADNNAATTDDVFSKRKERFGMVDDDSKKKLRAQRFQAK